MQTIIGKRDHTILALLLGCALRQSEAAHLTSEHFKRRDDYWAIVDIFGKDGHIRSVPVPNWVEHAVDCLTEAARFHTVTETKTSQGTMLCAAVCFRLHTLVKVTGLTQYGFVVYDTELFHDVKKEDVSRCDNQ